MLWWKTAYESEAVFKSQNSLARCSPARAQGPPSHQGVQRGYPGSMGVPELCRGAAHLAGGIPRVWSAVGWASRKAV